MSDLVPFVPSDDRSYNEQIKDALEQALSIHGTVLSDLQEAMNAILTMERAMQMCGVPNPHQAITDALKRKYKMHRSDGTDFHQHAERLLERGSKPHELNGEVLELVEGEVVDD